MTDMREAVARAICEAEGYSWEPCTHCAKMADALTTSLAAQDGLDEHFPTGLRQRPMRLATTDEVFEGPVFCDCCCGESFAGSDEQEVRQLWAEHALSAIKEQHND